MSATKKPAKKKPAPPAKKKTKAELSEAELKKVSGGVYRREITKEEWEKRAATSDWDK
jgi:bacteriocin-like protein